MADVAMRERHEFHLVGERSILGSQASGAEVAIRGARECDDPHGRILCLNNGWLWSCLPSQDYLSHIWTAAN
jgi:hypothetical protein